MQQSSVTSKPTLIALYDLVTGDEDARICKDIAEDACRDAPRNFFLHLLSSTASKVADELASPRLVLAWLLSALAAPTFMVGVLVPIREAGSLLPQLFIAAYIRGFAYRYGFWVIGSAIQGACVLAMAAVAVMSGGAVAGWLILGLLVVFSLARGICSVAHKDVLGKTISKARRGTLMGYSAALGGMVAIIVGMYANARSETVNADYFLTGMLVGAGLLWLVAALIFFCLSEQEGSIEGGGNAIVAAMQSFTLLRTDSAFRRFVATRALLLSTALSLPFYVVLAREQTQGGLGELGLLIVAAGSATSVSAPVWGRLADRSSRLVMFAAALLAGGCGLAVFSFSQWNLVFGRDAYGLAVLFFFVSVAHAGIRLGRKTYLVDLASQDTRAVYVALSNTVIGVLLLIGGTFGVVAQWLGTRYVILLFSGIALLGAMMAWRLKEV